MFKYINLQVQIRKTQREQNLAKKRAEALNEAAKTGRDSLIGGAPFGAAEGPQGTAMGAPQPILGAPQGTAGGPQGTQSSSAFSLEGVDLQQLVKALASGVPETELEVCLLYVILFYFILFCFFILSWC